MSPWKAKRKTLAACAGSANARVATAAADTPRARVFRAERDKRISETVNAPPAGSPGGVHRGVSKLRTIRIQDGGRACRG